MNFSTNGHLSAQADAIVTKVKELDASKENLSRAERLKLIQSLEKLTLQLKDPKEAIFDHLTNVMFVLFCLLSLRQSHFHIHVYYKDCGRVLYI